MVVKVRGAFVRQSHPETDDFFLVLRGTLRIELRDRVVTLGSGQMHVVPAGVKHRSVADEEVHLLLIESAGAPKTGDPATAVTKLPVRGPAVARATRSRPGSCRAFVAVGEFVPCDPDRAATHLFGLW